MTRGLTQQEVADQAGVTLRAYQHYEAGRRQPGMASVPTLARALQADPCDFFRDPPIVIEARVRAIPGPRALPAPANPAYVPSGAERMTREWMDYLDEELADVSDQEEREEIAALTQLLERKISRARRKQS